jgi:transcriptional regulator with XRE-family HTH domain
MVGLDTVRKRLLENVRRRIRTGELTERALARKAGLSQPHLHNILKGVRALNIDTGDQLMLHLGITLTDLLEPDELRRALFLVIKNAEPSVEVPVLQARIGAGLPWNDLPSPFERVSVPYLKVSRMHRPVVARLGDDPAMLPVLAAGDLVVLDTTERACAADDPEAFFAIEHHGAVYLRWIRRGRQGLYLIDVAGRQKPESWQFTGNARVLAHATPLRSIYPTELVYDPLLPPRDRPSEPFRRSFAS